MYLKSAACVASSVDPDLTPQNAASDPGLHCLPKPVCPKTWGYYGMLPCPFSVCVAYIFPVSHIAPLPALGTREA